MAKVVRRKGVMEKGKREAVRRKKTIRPDMKASLADRKHSLTWLEER